MPRGISDSGAIVGEYTADGILHGFLLDGGVYTTIDVPGATFTSYASEINDAGEIVGRFDIPGTNSGFLLSGETFTTLVTSRCRLHRRAGNQRHGRYHRRLHRRRHPARVPAERGRPTHHSTCPALAFTTPRKINDAGLIVGGYGAGGTTHGFIATAEPPARVQSVVVNDGSAQRSMVKSLTVTFDGPVTIDPGAFELSRQDGSLVGPERRHLHPQRPDGGGAHLHRVGHRRRVAGGWQLRADDPRRPDPRRASAATLDGDGDGTAGGDRSDAFFRLYGDSDGDRDVDLRDLGRFLEHPRPPGGRRRLPVRTSTSTATTGSALSTCSRSPAGSARI